MRMVKKMIQRIEPKTRAWFEEWHEPREFFDMSSEGLNYYYRLDRAPCHYLRDSYVAGQFASIWQDSHGPCEVRLVPRSEQFPDAQLRAGNKFLNLEITLALQAGKKLFEEGKELRDKARRGEIVLYNKTIEEHQAVAREAIPRVICKKAKKLYSQEESISLLVYTDDGKYLSCQEMKQLTEPWKDRFSGIYLLCGMNIVVTWPELSVLRGKVPF